jgi:cardiolipin synthase
MNRVTWLAGACLLGGLLVVAVTGGLRTQAQATEVTAPLAPADTELLLNPGFEGATGGVPDHWSKYGGTLTQVTAPVHGGSCAARFESNTSSTKWVYQAVTVGEGIAYVFSAWAVKNGPNIEEVYLRVSWYASEDSSGTALSHDDSMSHLTTDDPTYRFLTTGPITAPAGARSMRARLMLNPLDATPCNATYDDASFRQAGALESAADLAIAKTGPATATPGDLITYHVALSNTGSTTATAVRVTDTLPTVVNFATQASPFTFTPSGRELIWQLGDVPTDTRHLITVTARVSDTASGPLINLVTATTTASETVTADNAANWATTVLPHVRLYGLAPANHGGSGEAAALINLSPHTATLAGWCLDNDFSPATRACFPPGAQISPRQILWLAQDSDGFYPVWGFDADWAAQAVTRLVPTLNGSWPIGFLADAGGEAYLLDAAGNVVDCLAYGTGSASQGWSGPAVSYPYPGYGPGQVLYRKLDQDTGLPVPDTDSAADWAQDADDPVDGRKLRYPGWDLEALFFPAEITTTATLTLAVAPEGALDVVSRTVGSARHTLRIEAYTLESGALYQVISDRIRAGVVVTVLLESGPPGGLDDVEKWIVQRLHNPPTSTVTFIGKTAPRYRYQHAKFILVDGRLALVSSDNFGENSMPSDPKDNGTMGHRGFVAVTDSPGVVTHLAEIFHRDCDPLHHLDVAPYDDTCGPPDGFPPLPPPDWTTYTAPFTAPLVTTATHVTVLHAPENTLRNQDGLLGLLGRTGPGDPISVMQLNEPYTWTTGAGLAGLNPRLQAIVAAARRGAEVRVLLDDYYDSENTEACLALNGVAAQEGLSLTCRLANVTGLGIHAKAFLVRVGDERWVHLGSINGTENANKSNREVALQFRSAAAYDWMLAVFDHDWQMGHAPMVHSIRFPLMMRDCIPPAGYPLVAEVFVNPEGEDASKEWIELYNPGLEGDISGWTVGDATDIGDYGDGRYTFPAGARILHGQVIVAAACATDFSAACGFNPTYEWTDCDAAVPDLVPAGPWEGFGLALGNKSDEVVLLDAGGALVDSAAWGGEPRVGVVPYPLGPGEDFPRGASLKRYPPYSDRDDCSRDFYASYTPSPGMVAGVGNGE